MIIGITGMMGAGKSTASNILAAHGAIVIDADALSRELTANGGEALSPIRAAFGGGVFDGEALDRKKLAGKVFSDPQALERLNGILHPLVIKRTEREVQKLLEENPSSLIVIDAPLLIEAGMHEHVHSVWLVAASEENCVNRCMERDGMTRDQALQRLGNQMPFAQKRQYADVVLTNDGSAEELEKLILKELHEEVYRG